MRPFDASLADEKSKDVYVLEDDELVLRASKNPHPDVVDRLKLRVGQGITGWAALATWHSYAVNQDRAWLEPLVDVIFASKWNFCKQASTVP